MADENPTVLSEGAEAELPTVPSGKKTRKPRAEKAQADSVPASLEAGEIKPRRGRRKAAVASTEVAPVRRGRKAKTTAQSEPSKERVVRGKKDTAASTVAVDDIAVLLSLETENKALRKELSDKLRAENAELRKRLGRN